MEVEDILLWMFFLEHSSLIIHFWRFMEVGNPRTTGEESKPSNVVATDQQPDSAALPQAGKVSTRPLVMMLRALKWIHTYHWTWNLTHDDLLIQDALSRVLELLGVKHTNPSAASTSSLKVMDAQSISWLQQDHRRLDQGQTSCPPMPRDLLSRLLQGSAPESFHDLEVFPDVVTATCLGSCEVNGPVITNGPIMKMTAGSPGRWRS